MIRIVDDRNRAAEAAVLEGMFEDRKRLFVDLLGWQVPVVHGRYEIDSFDRPGAIYLLALDHAGAHQGSLRLLPSARPHILDTVFPQLCAHGIPRGANIYEITRLCLPTRLGAHADILGACELVLRPWCDRIALNLTQAVEIHPGALAQFPHWDQDMWAGSKGEIEYLVNVMWPLTPFTEGNGGTRLWPSSHLAQDAERLPLADSVVPQLEPGDALLFLGSTLHGGGANASATPRRGIIVSYCLGWLKPFELQWLVYPPEIARHFDPELAALIGYAQHRPNLGNVEGQCPSVLLAGQVDDHRPAIDALRPDQEEALAGFVAKQRGDRSGGD